MPATVTETESFPTAVQGPAGGDARTATSVRAMGEPLASRTLWNRRRLQEIFGAHIAITSVDTVTNVITSVGHTYVNGDVLRMISVGGSVPGGLLANLALHVINVSGDTYQLSLTSGGPAVDITSAGTGTLYTFKVGAALDPLVHAAFHTLRGDTIPAGPLRITLAAYYMPTQGGSFTGPVTHVGDNAYRVKRHGALTDTATQTFTGTQKDHWLCPNVSQDSVYTIANGTVEGQSFVVSRRVGLSAFKADFVDTGANQICRFPASAKSWCRFAWSNQDGAGAKWHADEYGGSAIPGT